MMLKGVFLTFLVYGLCRECEGEYVNWIYIAGRFDKAIGKDKKIASSM